MKRGAKVAVCHDGKWSRRVEGVVVGTRRGHHIRVSFHHPGTDATVEFWARKIPAVRHRKERPSSRYCTTVTFARPAYYGGWADIEWFCPWFSVHPWKDEKDA